jgi:S-adenosylmethionine synthetase
MRSGLLFTSESVTEGHPDKLCDQISDAVLDECLAQDPASRVACEVLATGRHVVVCGEITTAARIDVAELVRAVARSVGYGEAESGLDLAKCVIDVDLALQSTEIAKGVGHRGERGIGAGDQGLMFGFATRETTDFMPLPISLAHAVSRQLAVARRSGEFPYLRPDGKSQVTVEYRDGKPSRIHTVVVAAHHRPGISPQELREYVRTNVIETAIGADLLDDRTNVVVNRAGPFTFGGPDADAGVTGRKTAVDTYGGYARHGGGAFSGKDPTKVDRSGAYAARYVAKNIVAANLADRVEIQLAYVIGQPDPVSLRIESFGTSRASDDELAELVLANFDFSPGSIIERFDLRRPIYRQTATYGHFGRPDLDLPWEQLDLAPSLRR